MRRLPPTTHTHTHTHTASLTPCNRHRGDPPLRAAIARPAGPPLLRWAATPVPEPGPGRAGPRRALELVPSTLRASRMLSRSSRLLPTLHSDAALMSQDVAAGVQRALAQP